MSKKVPCLILCAILLLASLSAKAQASTATTTFAVSATVLSICLVTATPLVFGNYDATSSTPLTTTSSIVVTCSSGAPYTVALNAGTGTSATVASRNMTFGSNSLNYMLYSNSSRTTLWGDGTSSTSTVGGTAGLLPTTLTVYGSIPISQHVGAGAYTDLVTVTVSY